MFLNVNRYAKQLNTIYDGYSYVIFILLCIRDNIMHKQSNNNNGDKIILFLMRLTMLHSMTLNGWEIRNIFDNGFTVYKKLENTTELDNDIPKLLHAMMSMDMNTDMSECEIT